MKNQAQTFDEYELGPFRAAWEVSEIAQDGDIVEIDMVIFSKFAIHIGDGNIVYVTDPDPDTDTDSMTSQYNDHHHLVSGERVNHQSSYCQLSTTHERSSDDNNNRTRPARIPILTTSQSDDLPHVERLLQKTQIATKSDDDSQQQTTAIDCQDNSHHHHHQTDKTSPVCGPPTKKTQSSCHHSEESLDNCSITQVSSTNNITSRDFCQDQDVSNQDDEASSASLCSVMSGVSSISVPSSLDGCASKNRASNNVDLSSCSSINTHTNNIDCQQHQHQHLFSRAPSISLSSSSFSSSMMLATPSNLKNCITITTNSKKRNSSLSQLTLNCNLANNSSQTTTTTTTTNNNQLRCSTHNRGKQHSATPPPQPSICYNATNNNNNNNNNNLKLAHLSGQHRGRAASTSALGSGSASGSVTPRSLFPTRVPSGFRCVVRCAPLVEVAANSKCRINNKLPGASQRSLEPLPVRQVVEHCRSMIGKEIDFHMLKYNSEYYVTKWKYNTGWSDQASIMKRAVSSLQNSHSMADKHQLLVDNINAVFNQPGNNPPLSISPPPPLNTGHQCHSPVTGQSTPASGNHYFSGNLISNFNNRQYNQGSDDINNHSSRSSPLMPPKNIVHYHHHRASFSVAVGEPITETSNNSSSAHL